MFFDLDPHELTTILTSAFDWWVSDLKSGNQQVRFQAERELADARRDPSNIPLFAGIAAATGREPAEVLAALEAKAARPHKKHTSFRSKKTDFEKAERKRQNARVYNERKRQEARAA